MTREQNLQTLRNLKKEYKQVFLEAHSRDYRGLLPSSYKANLYRTCMDLMRDENDHETRALYYNECMGI